MSKNLEIEAKVMIEEDGYLKLMSSFESEDNKAYLQDNYYIDTPDFAISEHKMGMRVRRKDNGFFEFTIKDKKDEGKLEINQRLSEKEFKDFLDGKIPTGEVLEYLENKIKIDVNELKCYALLSTVRLDLKYKKSLVSIDKSTYNGIVDYEVEVESDSMEQAKKDLHEFLTKEKVSFTENHISKLKRARESLKRH